jgi:hypothetical protein
MIVRLSAIATSYKAAEFLGGHGGLGISHEFLHSGPRL